MAIEIVSPSPALKADWRRLYDGYAAHYKREMTDVIAETVWGWINDPAQAQQGVIALWDGVPVGLAHFQAISSPLEGTHVGFLDDLFVAETARGKGIAKALLAHLNQVGHTRGWEILSWITADDNYRARSLYDQVAQKASWNVYEMKIRG
ncbi:MAG: GNAT family N-acetyltransferase [Aestuariivirgaceae bacterium]|nr:GNAT family N-acetyltransferase [Aestuariivirgaceae bacterium]